MTLNDFKKTDGGKGVLDVGIEPEIFRGELDRQYKKNKNKIVINGYRKGKVPRAIVESMYGEDFFFEDAINSLLPDAFDAAVKEAGIEVVGRPDIDVPEVSKEKGIKAMFTVTLRPELSVKNYRGLKATKVVHTVEENDIDSEIDKLREKGSRLVIVEDRPAENGDVTVIDFEGFVDGEAFAGGKGEDFSLTLGSGQFIPGFEDQITGRSASDEFDITVQFP